MVDLLLGTRAMQLPLKLVIQVCPRDAQLEWILPVGALPGLSRADDVN